MKRLAIVGMTLAIALAAGPANAAQVGKGETGPPFITGNPAGDKTIVVHCKAIGGSGVAVAQQHKGTVIDHCTPPE